MTGELSIRPAGAVATTTEWTVDDLVAQVSKIQKAMKAVMRQDEHFGIIPGTPKPTLYKPGAEKLCLLFRLDPQFEIREIREGNHLTVISTCTLYNINTGQRMGSGMGSCSTKESKYGYRDGKRLCPKCGKDAIIKGKADYGGGWLCFARKGGCGAKFGDQAKEIIDQKIERVENPDIADTLNTVLKMSNKRAMVAAVLVVTGASDIFTQDLEDLQEFQDKAEAKAAAQAPPTNVQAPARGEKVRKVQVDPNPTVVPDEDQHIPTYREAGDEPVPPADDMPEDLAKALGWIAGAKTLPELANVGVDIAALGLEASLRGEAAKAYGAKQAALKKAAQ